MDNSPETTDRPADPLMDASDHPSGPIDKAKIVPSLSAPSTPKKRIKPVNEAAVRETLAETTPGQKPVLNVSNIYQSSPAPAEPHANLSLHIPTPGDDTKHRKSLFAGLRSLFGKHQ